MLKSAPTRVPAAPKCSSCPRLTSPSLWHSPLSAIRYPPATGPTADRGRISAPTQKTRTHTRTTVTGSHARSKCFQKQEIKPQTGGPPGGWARRTASSVPPGLTCRRRLPLGSPPPAGLPCTSHTSAHGCGDREDRTRAADLPPGDPGQGAPPLWAQLVPTPEPPV